MTLKIQQKFAAYSFAAFFLALLSFVAIFICAKAHISCNEMRLVEVTPIVDNLSAILLPSHKYVKP